MNLLCMVMLSMVPIVGLVGTSAADDRDMAFRGLGISACEDFKKFVDGDALLSSGKKQGDVVDTETAFYTWAQGFWTGMNGILLHTGQQSTNLNIRSMQDQKNYLYDFCAGNPKEEYYSGALRLFIEMRTQQGLPMWQHAEP